MRKIGLLISALLLATAMLAAAPRDRVLLNNDWTFHLGYAGDMMKDFTHGTEYFTTISKVQSIDHNYGPARPDFDDSGWQKVSLPHDWVVDLPFSGEASHSHGYKCVGWRYPENSVGWYRKHLFIPSDDQGRRIVIEFEGVYRDSQVYCNGCYLGGERSGYMSKTYDITDYIDYGKDNVITVRCDASLEEGWYYEGAGIYESVWLTKTDPVAIAPYGVQVKEYEFGSTACVAKGVVKVLNRSLADAEAYAIIALKNASGKSVAKCKPVPVNVVSAGETEVEFEVRVPNPARWSLDDPYLYNLEVTLTSGTMELDRVDTKIGFREIEFRPDGGFFLNGERVQLKGCDLHLDHAGVGSAVPEELWRYRLLQLRKYGFNAIRSSHNPANPAMLKLCDELGFAVIDENREFGSSAHQLDQFRRMIERDINHPCVILWSIGNEEWAVEWKERGADIARQMTAFAHNIDQSRLTTYGNCSGRDLVKGVDVFGYNYIVQNPILEYHETYPDHCAVGTEETSGAGTRSKYFTVPEEGWMQPINRRDSSGVRNVIERGWKFYKENKWAGGLFYWTGIDYRGEPNPMKWPATGSQFGILDYCAYPKDEAFYLQSVWTSDPVLHVSPHWNNPVEEGGKIDVYVYSNCDKVALKVNGKTKGSKKMPADGHLRWEDVQYYPGKIEAVGYIKGKEVAHEVIETTGPAASFELEASRKTLAADGQDIVVVDVTVLDDKGRFVQDAAETVGVSVRNACFLGWGNGNPGFKAIERPVDGSNFLAVQTFGGRAQILVRSVEGARGPVTVQVGNKSITLNYK